MRSQFRNLIKTVPSVPIYCYLAILAVSATWMFIFLLSVVQ
jgi:hypothetical protein